ncbi:MAG: TlpA disulfide reductase family protein [Victivallales bacterium]|jgi:thiol-disulfide isomerase/thioredoxin
MKKMLMSGIMVFTIFCGISALAGNKLKLGDAAPEVSVKMINEKEYGKTFSLAEFKDKVVVLEFWATWCPPCRQSIPHLSKLQEKYKDKAVVIGISGEDRDVVEKFFKEQKEMKYRVAIDDINKTSGIYMTGFGVNGIPHAFIIKDGKIIWHGHPMEMDENLAKAVGNEKK